MSDLHVADRHLLVVDDDDRIRELLKEYLARAGFRVTTARGGAPARKLMETLDFDLAVFDVMMPGEDGFSLTRWLRERKGAAGRTPVLMLTARGLPEDRIEGLKLGADDYLNKPFEPEELLLRIEAILRRAQRRIHFEIGLEILNRLVCQGDVVRANLTADFHSARPRFTQEPHAPGHPTLSPGEPPPPAASASLDRALRSGVGPGDASLNRF